MATRRLIIQRALRQIYGGQPSDDSQITELLANAWLNDAVGAAAKANYIDSIKVDGIAAINNSFCTIFSGLAITAVDQYTYRVALPQIPVAIGKNQGLPSLRLQYETQQGFTGKSLDCIPMTIDQVGINGNRRKIPNKYEYWYSGNYAYVITTGQELDLGYTAIATIVSGGDSSDLDSVLIIPDDYMYVIVEYFKAQLGFELNRPQDVSNNGADDNSMK